METLQKKHYKIHFINNWFSKAARIFTWKIKNTPKNITKKNHTQTLMNKRNLLYKNT
jgi:hypothetical protein